MALQQSNKINFYNNGTSYLHLPTLLLVDGLRNPRPSLYSGPTSTPQLGPSPWTVIGLSHFTWKSVTEAFLGCFCLIDTSIFFLLHFRRLPTLCSVCMPGLIPPSLYGGGCISRLLFKVFWFNSLFGGSMQGNARDTYLCIST